MTGSKPTFTKSQTLTAILFLASAVFVLQAVAQQTEERPNHSQTPTMMMGKGRGMMGMSHDARTGAEMGVIHELVVNHDRIKRTVTNLPDGSRTVTESDDPKIAQLIKEHVASMDQRVETRDDPGLPIESPALRTILRNGDKVRLSTETTATGVIVTQTSTDPETIRALQQHASEVSDLVQGGMMALHAAMMKNSGGMHGSMMGHAPDGAPAPNPQEKETNHAHDTHLADVNKRGDQVMGFDHAKTTHHFRLTPEGGAIEVEANDPQDKVSRDQIRQHLRHIAELFADGDFNAPLLIHAQTPPGVPVMKRLKAAIQYRFQEIERGGRVRIRTANREAITAIHEFLRFQIEDHATGDSGSVDKP